MNNHIITISDRKEISLTHVNNVISFNENEFLVDTNLGKLKITGKNLTIGKMDTDRKDLIIKGNIDSVSYLKTANDKNSNQKESVFSKLFK